MKPEIGFTEFRLTWVQPELFCFSHFCLGIVHQQSWLFWFWNLFTLGLAHIFFRNKTLLFVKIDSWNFQHLFHLSRISWSLTKVRTPEYLDYVMLAIFLPPHLEEETLVKQCFLSWRKWVRKGFTLKLVSKENMRHFIHNISY